MGPPTCWQRTFLTWFPSLILSLYLKKTFIIGKLSFGDWPERKEKQRVETVGRHLKLGAYAHYLI